MKDNFLTAGEFVRNLEATDSSLLVVDCRPLTAFSHGHIRGAVHAFCPSILWRRGAARGYIRLEAVLEPEVRKQLRAGEFKTLVLYDEGASPREPSELHLILQGLHKYPVFQSVVVLKGKLDF